MDDFLSAHGLGGAKDLPIPSELAIAGAVAALVVSFTVLAVAWRTPRFDAATSGRPAPAWLDRLTSSAGFAIALRALGLAFFAYVGWGAVAGQDLLTNPFFGTLYVLVWVGIVPASLLFGSFWKAVSPARAINAGLARLARTDPDEGMFTYPERLGYWPAALGLFAFVWMELVYPYATELGPARLWVAVYLGAMVIGGLLFGNRFLERADPFEVYSTLVGRLSVWGHRDGRLVVRSPLANLDTTVVAPGLVAVVGTLFGSTGYDSFRESPTWVQFTQRSASPYLLDNLALVGFCVGATAIFALGCAATGVGPGTRRSRLPDLFAHSIVPIIVGYIVAHYLTYFVETGQLTLIQLSDPLSRGDNWLGTADLSVDYWLSQHPTFLAVSKVVAVVAGHVLGVIAAHDRAIAILPRRHQLTGQLSLLVAMVTFTAGGLYLLFSA